MNQIAQPLQPGSAVPDFQIRIQDGSERTLAHYKGKKWALYFYPKDMTPGCTTQACNLSEHFDKLSAAGVGILGVSPDDEKKHIKFIEKYGLRIDLACDEDLKLHQLLGVWGLKKFMGKEYEGTHRTTFLINEEGIIHAVISKPNTKDHAAEILNGFGLK